MKCASNILSYSAVLLLCLVSLPGVVVAQNWGAFATISTSMGVQPGRLCVGEASRGDVGCPAYAPYVDATNGNIGIGTSTPLTRLDISSTGHFRVYENGAFESYRPITAAGSFLTAVRSDTDGIFSIRGNGSVGVALQNSAIPSTTLHVSGTIRIADSGEPCDANRAGAIRYRAGTFEFCSGSLWQSLSVVAAALAASDRIVSSTTAAVVANQSGGTVSFTLGGTAGAAYMHPTLGLVGPGVSTTGSISATQGYIGNRLAIGGNAPSWIPEKSLYVANKIYVDEYVHASDFAVLNPNGGYHFDDWTTNIKGNRNHLAVTVASTPLLYGLPVGLGVLKQTPVTALDVSGTLRIANGGEACTSTLLGAIRYTSSTFHACRNGTAWETLMIGTSGADTDRITSGTTRVTANGTGYISLTTGGVTTGYFDTAGRLIVPGVGVGTANPAAHLEVSGTIAISARNTWPMLMVQSINPSYPPSIVASTTRNWAALQANDIVGTTSYRGHVGEVANITGIATAAHTAASTPGAMLFETTSPGSIWAQERMRITASGTIGIGTTAPASALDVSGTIRSADNKTTGAVYGIYGQVASTSGYGLFGLAYATTGVTYGAYGEARSSNGMGVFGYNNATTGNAYGVVGQSRSTSGYGVFGYVSSTTGTNFGVVGQSPSINGRGVFGYANAASGYGIGVIGESNSPNGYGIWSEGQAYVNGNLTVTGAATATAFNQSSDARLKTNIATSGGLAVVEKLRGVTFDWKKSGRPSAGVIAQEVERVMPSAIGTDMQGMKTVNYDQLVAPLIEAVKELNERVRTLEAENDKLQDMRHDFEALKAHVAR